MRIGGVFNFGSPQSSVSLNGGEAYYPAAGNYLVSTGLCTVLQYQDPSEQIWRNVICPASLPVPISMDGTNWRLLNMSGVATGALVTNVGTSGTPTNGIGTAATGVTVSFGAAPTNGRAASAYPIVGGSINTTVAISQAGSGFLVPPILVFDAPPLGGTRATGRVTSLTTAGGINAVTVDEIGAGYLTAPNITIIPQTQFYAGSGLGGVAAPAYPPPGNVGQSATSTANVPGAFLTVNPVLTNANRLTALVMTDYGFGYAGTTIPTITIGGTLTGAAATAIMAFSMQSITLVAGGVAYGAGAPPIWETSLGLVSANDQNNGVYLPRAARGVTTVSAGAVATFPIEDPGFGLQKVPTVAVINTSAIATTIATGTAVVGGIQDTSLLQLAVQ